MGIVVMPAAHQPASTRSGPRLAQRRAGQRRLCPHPGDEGAQLGPQPGTGQRQQPVRGRAGQPAGGAKGLNQLTPGQLVMDQCHARQRHALVHDQLTRGELVEPFGAAGRLPGPAAYWLLPLPGARLRPELRAFIAWVRAEAALTRAALGEPVADAPAAAG